MLNKGEIFILIIVALTSQIHTLTLLYSCLFPYPFFYPLEIVTFLLFRFNYDIMIVIMKYIL